MRVTRVGEGTFRVNNTPGVLPCSRYLTGCTSILCTSTLQASTLCAGIFCVLVHYVPAHLIYWYIKYHPNCGTRILRTILGIRLRCRVLSPKMYQYMPETWTLRVTSKGGEAVQRRRMGSP